MRAKSKMSAAPPMAIPTIAPVVRGLVSSPDPVYAPLVCEDIDQVVLSHWYILVIKGPLTRLDGAAFPVIVAP